MAFNWGGAGTGAASGAIAGSSFGPWGTAIGGGIGGLAGGLSQNPADKAMKSLNDIPEQLRPFFEPYFKAGTDALGKAGGAYGEQMSNPGDIISRLGSGYKQSPGYQWNLGQQEQQIANAQARGGMAGSRQDQQYSAELASHLADQDYQSYLANALGLYNGGVSGQNDIAKMGQRAGEEYGLSLGANAQSKAKLGYEGNAATNAGNSDMMSNLIKYLHDNPQLFANVKKV